MTLQCSNCCDVENPGCDESPEEGGPVGLEGQTEPFLKRVGPGQLSTSPNPVMPAMSLAASVFHWLLAITQSQKF